MIWLDGNSGRCYFSLDARVDRPRSFTSLARLGRSSRIRLWQRPAPGYALETALRTATTCDINVAKFLNVND